MSQWAADGGAYSSARERADRRADQCSPGDVVHGLSPFRAQKPSPAIAAANLSAPTRAACEYFGGIFPLCRPRR